MNFFATNLKFLREKEGLTRKELSDKLNVNPSTLTRWENEEVGATVKNAIDVSDYFNISVADLTGIDLRLKNNSFDELDVLFKKYKGILTDEDKETMRFLIEKRKREIDRQNNN